MPKGVHARIFGLEDWCAPIVTLSGVDGYACRNLGGDQSAIDDVRQRFDIAAAIREN